MSEEVKFILHAHVRQCFIRAYFLCDKFSNLPNSFENKFLNSMLMLVAKLNVIFKVGRRINFRCECLW